MKRLRVQEPDTLTRVTEYVPEIVSFVERIIQNGYAYESEGSVYFNTQTFDKAPIHDYAKLEPWSKGNWEKLEGGEGKVLAIRPRATLIHYKHNSYAKLCRIFHQQSWTAIRIRFCSLESLQTWGTFLAFALGSGTTRMAH